MSNITDPVLVAPGAPSIASFGAGGQMYNADIFGGFNISAQQVNPLFSFRSTDPGVTNAALLTNLTEAQKIGSTMDFKAVALEPCRWLEPHIHAGWFTLYLQPHSFPISRLVASPLPFVLPQCHVDP